MEDKERAFLILNFLNSESNYYINQKFKIVSPKLNESREGEYMMKQFSNVSLIGINYEIKISSSTTEQFLIYATPLEHLLSINIILKSETSLYRIEYEYQNCLILPKHLDYLQKPYTFLEEIESKYLHNFYYTTPFEQSITKLLPESWEKSNRIIVNDNNHNIFDFNKILLTPHINSNHSKFCIDNKIFLFNISSSKEYIEKIFKYSHYVPSLKNKHFLGAEVINIILARYFIEVIPSENDLAISTFLTTFYFKITPNLHLPLITNEKSNYPLPLFVSSSNSYINFDSCEKFRERTGVSFKFEYDLLQKLLIKENYAHSSQFCHFFIPKNMAEFVFENSIFNSYSTALEFYLKSTLYKSNSREPHELAFIPKKQFSYNYSALISKLLEIVKSNIIKNTHYPNSSKQGPLSLYCLQICKNLLNYKKELLQLSKSIAFQTQHNKKIYEFNSVYYKCHNKIYLQILHLLNTITYYAIHEEDISEICLVLENIYEIMKIDSIFLFTEFPSKCHNFEKLSFEFFLDLDIFSKNNYINKISSNDDTHKVPNNIDNSLKKNYIKKIEEEINTKLSKLQTQDTLTTYSAVMSLSPFFAYLKTNKFLFYINNELFRSFFLKINPNALEIKSNETFNHTAKNKKIVSNEIFSIFFD